MCVYMSVAMNISESFLQSFVGGIWHFRFACFEQGPDYYYLFRSRISALKVLPDGLLLRHTHFEHNRFTGGEWTRHDCGDDCVTQTFKVNTVWGKGQQITVPRFRLISPTIAFVQVDSVGEAVLYADEKEVPDDIQIFTHFPVGFEAFCGIGGIL
jgi:hypothetical protein